jgi:hypothetical protein
MAWNLYDPFRENQIDGSGGFDMETPGGNGIKVALVTNTYTPNQNTHDFWDDITNEVTGSNYTAGGNQCTSPAVTMDGSGLITFDAADPATWSQHATGFSNARRAIIYEDSGVSTTSSLIAYSDAFSADRGNVDGDFSITFDAAGVFTSAR